MNLKWLVNRIPVYDEGTIGSFRARRHCFSGKLQYYWPFNDIPGQKGWTNTKGSDLYPFVKTPEKD